MWLMLEVRGCQKKAGRTRQGEQTRKQQSFMASGSAPASRFCLLSSCPDFLRRWTIIWKCKHNKPFSLTKLLSVTVFIAAIETLPNDVRARVATDGHVGVHGPTEARVCADVRCSCYHRGPYRHPRLRAMWVSEGHAVVISRSSCC